jgi:hypothetical protein
MTPSFFVALQQSLLSDEVNQRADHHSEQRPWKQVPKGILFTIIDIEAF